MPESVWHAAYPLPFRDEVEAAAGSSGLDPCLLWALAREESGFDPRARSPAGALGLLQLMPGTAREIGARFGVTGDEESLVRPQTNLLLGAAYLAGLLDRWSGNLPLALAGYNAGPSRALAWWRAAPATDTEEFVDTIPYRETQAYVRSVLDLLRRRSWMLIR